MNLADELRVALSRALDEASKRRHEFLTLEHVLLALLHDPSTADVLKAVGCDLAVLERLLRVDLIETRLGDARVHAVHVRARLHSTALLRLALAAPRAEGSVAVLVLRGR